MFGRGRGRGSGRSLHPGAQMRDDDGVALATPASEPPPLYPARSLLLFC